MTLNLLALPILLLLLFKIEAKSAFSISPIFVFVALFFAYHLLPSTVPDWRKMSGVSDESYRLLWLNYWALLAGYVFTRLFFVPPRKRIDELDGQRSSVDDIGMATVYFLLLALSVLLVMQNFNVLLSLNQGLADLALARESVTVESSLYATAGPILVTIPPFVWAYYWYGKKKLASLGLWFATTLAILATGQKAPAAIWFFALVLTMGLFTKQKLIRILLVTLLVGLLTAGLLLWLIAIQNKLGVEQIEVILSAFRNRMFFAGPRALQAYLDFFPAQHPFIGINAGALAADQLVYNFANPNSQIQGTLNTAPIANLYAAGIPAPLSFLLLTFVGIAYAWLVGAAECASETKVSAGGAILLAIFAIRMTITDIVTASMPLILYGGFCLGLSYCVRMLVSGSTTGKLTIGKVQPIVAVLALLIFIYVLQGRIRSLF